MIQDSIPPNVQNPMFLNDEERVRVGKEIMINSLPSGTFFGMNLLASIIAAYGLLQNSPAVVIGAMLVAMMLGPIAGFGLAVLRKDRRLLGMSAMSIGLGTLWVIGIGTVIGLVHHQHVLTDEIIGRTAPNVMDLMIALAGGLAGAVAAVSTRLPVAVVGVGVATALVPPLVTCGILLSRGQFGLAGGAFLLTLTNMVAIQFAFAIVLWMAGFRRRKDGKRVGFVRTNIWSLVLLLGLGTLLTINLIQAATRQRLDAQLAETMRKALETGNNRLILVKLLADDVPGSRKDAITVMAYLQGDRAPTRAEVQKAQDALPSLKGLPPLRLQLRFVPVEIIEGEITAAQKR